MPSTPKPLSTDQLILRCDPAQFDFDSTAQLDATVDAVGQDRAMEAIELAVAVRQPGYNLFVLGEPGSGRHSVVQRLLRERAAAEPAPDDWCYVYNFADPNRPRLLRVPAGRGAEFAQDMERFVAELSRAIAAAFSSDDYQARIDAINSAYKEKEESSLQELGDAATHDGIALMRTPQGFIFTPLKGKGAMTPQQFGQLPEAEQKRISALMDAYGDKLNQLMQQLPRWRREAQAQMKAATRDTLALAAGHLIDELKERYHELAEIVAFLDEVMHDVLEAGEQLREQPRTEDGLNALVVSGNVPHQRYRVNALVAHEHPTTAPVVYEDNPIHPNLVGRIDQIAQLGTLVTNFMLIKPGALHRANGGYLLLDALKVLTQPYAWEGLKRALSSTQVRIESVGQAWGLVGSAALDPEPMPLSIKVVLIGEPRIYYLLKAMDPDFAELFKIAADFETELDRTPDNTRLYAGFIAALARRSGLRPVERGGVARLIEHAARLCGDAHRLSTNRRLIADLLREADHGAGRAGRERIEAADVQTALDAQIRRVDRLRQRLHEEILRGVLMVSVTGSRVGQINGLAVLTLDDFMFAHPVRISATTRLGESGVLDIERESDLGGAIHSKGVMILASFLASRYSPRVPLALSASVVFEQSYGPIEGDSASLAELCALLSSLSGVPIQQSLAVTGSVNQFGEVQAIGAVNEKIEGFFDICRARGLDGTQGVLIPATNVEHLMLRHDVVEACAAGRFHVWPIADVDQAIERLTGLRAGGVDEPGAFNQRVATALKRLAHLRHSFAEPKVRRAPNRAKG